MINEKIDWLRSCFCSELTDAVKSKLNDYDTLSDNKAEPLDSSIKEIEQELLGQYYFIKLYKRESILLELQDLPLWRRVDVLACWGWIKRHSEMIHNQNVKNLYKPFECKVGWQSYSTRVRHTIDREFWTLRYFLRRYNEQINEDYSFYCKRETPDFVVENSSGKRIGIEITDVNFDNSYPDNKGKRSDLLNEIRERTGIQDISHYNDGDYLDKWTSNPHEVVSFFGTTIKPDFETNRSTEKYYHFRGINITLDVNGNIFLANYPENLSMADCDYKYPSAIINGINRKLTGKEPEIRPCLLVVQPIIDGWSPSNPTSIRKSVLDKMVYVSYNTHFNEVWYTYRTGISDFLMAECIT